MTDNCHVGDGAIAPTNNFSPISFDSFRNGLTVEDMTRINTGKQSAAQPSMRLPEISIAKDSESTSTEGDRLGYCLTQEISNPKLLPAFSSTSLIQCDPEFKLLVTKAGEDGQSDEERAATARKLIEYTRQDDKYKDLLEPFLEGIYEAAYNY